MSSNKALLYRLKSLDPKERFEAIRDIARSKDTAMLATLEQIRERDSDPRVQEAARRAIEYFDELEQRVKPSPKVSPQNEERARQALNAAMEYHLNDQRDKAMRELARAVQLNPALENDPYYVSVLEETSGESAEEALKIIQDKSALKQVRVSEQALKQEKLAQDHQKDVQRSTWASAAMDLLIYTLIAVFGSTLLLIISMQSAQGLLSVYAEQMRLAQVETDSMLTPEMQADLRQMADYLQSFTLSNAILRGVTTGVASLFVLILQLIFTHLLARYMLRGKSTLPHLIYKVVSYYNGRLPVIYLLSFISVFLIFQRDMAIFAGLISLIIAGFSLILLFKTVGRVAEAYNFSAMSGCLALIIAVVLVAILNAGLWIVLTPVLMQAFPQLFPPLPSF